MVNTCKILIVCSLLHTKLHAYRSKISSILHSIIIDTARLSVLALSSSPIPHSISLLLSLSLPISPSSFPSHLITIIIIANFPIPSPSYSHYLCLFHLLPSPLILSPLSSLPTSPFHLPPSPLNPFSSFLLSTPSLPFSSHLPSPLPTAEVPSSNEKVTVIAAPFLPYDLCSVTVDLVVVATSLHRWRHNR